MRAKSRKIQYIYGSLLEHRDISEHDRRRAAIYIHVTTKPFNLEVSLKGGEHHEIFYR